MEQEILLALILKHVEERFEAIESQAIAVSPGPRGFRGFKGDDGTDGKDFNFSEHEEQIRKILSEQALKFSDLTPEQILSITGPRGDKGKDGKNFIFEEHREVISSLIKDSALKFSDLTEGEIESLRGPRGHKGRDGIDGQSFLFNNHKEEISEIILTHLGQIKGDLKLRFEDLTEEERFSLRGARGARGQTGKSGNDGKSFIFEDHKEYFDSLKPKFSDFTQEEKDSLKLRFEQLTDEDKLQLRGSRGQRGRHGEKGDKGDKGDSIVGPQGMRGLPGVMGAQGLPGVHGRDGIDGKDAPTISDIDISQDKNSFKFIVYLSDGSYYETKEIKIPSGGSAYSFIGLGGGGSGSGADGKSAYEIWLDEGNTGTVTDFLNSLIGPPGVDGTDGIDGAAATIAVGTVTTGAPGSPATVTNVGTSSAAVFNFSIPRGNTGAPGSGSGGYLADVPCETSVFVGAVVRLEKDSPTELNMSDWTSLNMLPSMLVFSYSSIAKNAIATSLPFANFLGVVIAKPTSTTCDIMPSGQTANTLFLGLDVEKEYFLSDQAAGYIVDESYSFPSGAIKIRIGQPTDSQSLHIVKGIAEVVV